MNKLAINGLQIVAEHGPVDIFLTLTCNKNWPEILEVLPPGHSAFDHPEIVTLVFKSRLDAMIADLKNGRFFGGRRLAYSIRVIEYQERGLPHAHIVFKLKGKIINVFILLN